MDYDVFLAILAMDAYNRGGSGLRLTGPVGNAIPYLAPPPLSTGFSAVAYNWGGRSVISYRGTDFTPDGALPDILNGWSLFSGIGTPHQASDAINFYNSAISLSNNGLPILVGHSLGGGLAGYIGSQFRNSVVAFDPIPFAARAVADSIWNAFTLTVRQMDLNIDDVQNAILPTVLYPTQTIGNSTTTLQQFAELLQQNISNMIADPSSLRGYYLEGEIAHDIPRIQLAAGSLTPISFLSALGYHQFVQGIINQSSENTDGLTVVPNHGISQNPVTLHSMSLLATLLFGEKQWETEGGKSSWTHSANLIFSALSDDMIASAVGAPSGVGMSHMIAYSAVNEGTMPYGNSGIRALYNDADDFGEVLRDHSSQLPNVFDQSAREALGRLVAEYAGLLAAREDVNQDHRVGILHTGMNGAAHAGEGLFVDFSKNTWTVGGLHIPQGKEPFINALLKVNGTSELLPLIKAWYAQYGGGGETDLVKAIDQVILAYGTGSFFSLPPDAQLALTVGSSLGDQATFQGERTDFVLGAEGQDKISGGNGNDIIVGGDGNDTLWGGAGNDWIHGGSGDDKIYGDVGTSDIKGTRDVVDYSLINHPIQIVYSDKGSDGVHVTVVGDGTDTLFGINYIVATGNDDVVRIEGTILPELNLTINANGGQIQYTRSQTILANNYGGGLRLQLDQTGNGYVADRHNGGVIKLEGFGTEIVGSRFDDQIIDLTPHEKVVDGGLGSDIIVTGSGADIIIDAQTFGVTQSSNFNPDYPASMMCRSVIYTHGDDDIIAISQSSGEIMQRYFRDLPPHKLDYYVEPGTGNDVLKVNFTAGEIVYSYNAGDGNDVIHRNAHRVVTYDWYGEPRIDDPTRLSHESYYDTYGSLIDLDIKGYDISQVTFIWNYESISNTMLAGNAHELDASWYIIGDVTVIFPDGGSIFIENVQGGAGTLDELSPELSSSAHIEFGDLRVSFDGVLSETPLNIVLSSAAQNRSANYSALSSINMRDASNHTDAANREQLHVVSSGLDNDASLSLRNISRFSRIFDRDAYDYGHIRHKFFEDTFDHDSYDAEATVRTLASAVFEQQYSPSGQSTLSGSSQTVRFGRSDNSYIGAGSDDTIIITFAASDLNAYVDGSDIIISDAWGVIGTTRLTGFEHFTLLQEDVTLTAAEFIDYISAQKPVTFTGGTGDDQIDGTHRDDIIKGQEGNDTLSGMDGNDVIYGNDGDDVLIGGAGADFMSGGAGNDIFQVDNIDDFVDGGDGYDRIEASVSYNLSNFIEVITLVGISNINAIGNYYDNIMIGNAGNNLIDGDFGADQMYGGGGDDLMIIDNVGDIAEGGDGRDQVHTSVTHTLHATTEDIALSGNDNINAYGNAYGNIMAGNAGNNIIDGGIGIDYMTGGDGDDILIVDNSDDMVDGDGGRDIVHAYASYALTGSTEDIRLMGNASISAVGNAYGNIMYGNDGDNHLDGGLGVDYICGGAGNDVMHVDHGDDVADGGDGHDLVFSSVSYALSATTEDGVLFGSTDISMLGNGLGNALYGSSGDNILWGLGGDDRLNGRLGADILYGGAGSDVFVFEANTGRDIIGDFENGTDRIDLSAFGLTYADLTYRFQQSGNDAWFQLPTGEIIVLSNFEVGQLDVTDFIL